MLAVVTTAVRLGPLDRRWAGRPIWLLVAAGIGGALLVIVAVTRWAVPSDEHAYWLAARRLIEGQPLYDPAATIVTPYAYLYPPPLAQAMVPIALIVPDWLFSAIWTVGMLVALWWLAGRDILRALALVAFLPVAVEFWFRNVHLFLAVLIVLGLRGAPWALSVGAAIKVSPGLGLFWFAGRGRWRDTAIMLGAGVAILVVSVALAPDQWLAWIDYLRAQDPFAQSAFFGVPFPIRAVVALVLSLIASRILGWRGEVLLVGAMTLALPSLWFTGLSLLVAAVPLIRERDLGVVGGRSVARAPTTHPGE
jgi:Glycosyltransferase family 87